MAFDTSITPATAAKYSPAPEELPSTRLQAGSPGFRRTARAMFVGGFATFALLYGMQPLMPMFSVEFNLMPAAASGVVSAATGAMAIALIPASLLADRFGRKQIMNVALALASVLTLLATFATSFQQLVVLRGLMGLALADCRPSPWPISAKRSIRSRSAGRWGSTSPATALAD